MKQSPVVLFEMPAKDKGRVAKFYSDAFGWRMTQLGPEMNNFLLAGTTPTGENQMVQKPGEINGGFSGYNKTDLAFNAPHVIIRVENINETIEAVKSAGGKLAGDKYNIPGIGEYVGVIDTEGNYVGVLQPPKK